MNTRTEVTSPLAQGDVDTVRDHASQTGQDQQRLTDDEAVSREALAAAGLLDTLETFRRRMEFLESMRQVWSGLTEQERSQLGSDLSAVYLSMSTIQMWMLAKNHDNWYRALVDLAEDHGWFPRSLQRRFWDAVGGRDSQRDSADPTNSPRMPLRPSLESRLGKLFYGGALARKLRFRQEPTSLQKIVEAFEAAGWPRQIPNPLLGLDENVTHTTVYRLNKGLKFIQFHATDSGHTLLWEESQS